MALLRAINSCTVTPKYGGPPLNNLGPTISTYAIIEDDAKIVSEMRRYLRELDDDAVIREFKNSKEFESFYFKSLLEPGEKKEDTWNPVANFSDEETMPLRQAHFSESYPFEAKFLDIKINTESLAVEEIQSDEESLFGFSKEQVSSADFALFEMIPAEFEKTKTQFANLKSFTESTTVFLGIQAPERDGVEPGVWAFKAQIEPGDGSIEIRLTPKNPETLKALGREDEIPDNQKGLIRPVDVCFYNNDCIKDEDKLMWVTKVATLLKKVHLWPIEDRPKFIALRYDNDETEKAGYSHPFVDDILCMPLDRLIFLQKTEIALENSWESIA